MLQFRKRKGTKHVEEKRRKKKRRRRGGGGGEARRGRRTKKALISGLDQDTCIDQVAQKNTQPKDNRCKGNKYIDITP